MKYCLKVVLVLNNHRIAEVRRALWKLYSPTFLEHLLRTVSSEAWNTFMVKESRSSLGCLFSCLTTLTGKRTPQAFSFLRVNNSSFLSLSSHVKCLKSLLILVAYHCLSLASVFPVLYWENCKWTQYSRYDHFNLYYFDH